MQERLKLDFDGLQGPAFDEKDHESTDSDTKRNGVFETSISLVSIIMGGGVVSVPYAYTTAGFKAGIVIQIFVVASMLYSC